MNDEYVKTLVIDDPNYRPGEICPPPSVTSNTQLASPPAEAAKVAAPKDVAAILDDAQPDSADDYPAFEDTDWLT